MSITLYTFPTPNGHKASILLEELGLPYAVERIDLARGDNKNESYRAINPVGKIPALLETLADGTTLRLFGSGAILMHYASIGNGLVPVGEKDQAETWSWFFLGISDLAPAAVDYLRFSQWAPEPIPYAIDLFKGELVRCYLALDQRLEESEFLGGAAYSVADIACFSFIYRAATMVPEILERYPNIARWHQTISARPAVIRGLAVPD